MGVKTPQSSLTAIEWMIPVFLENNLYIVKMIQVKWSPKAEAPEILNSHKFVKEDD